MLDYRLPFDYATQRAEDRVRDTRDHLAVPHRGVRRVFRIGDSRPSTRETGRR